MVMRFAALAALLVSLGTAGEARAESLTPDCSEPVVACARKAFDSGVASYQRGAFDAARQHFAHANRLTPHPVIVFNLALAEVQAGRYLLACSHLEGVRENEAATVELRERASKQLELCLRNIASVAVTHPANEQAVLDVGRRRAIGVRPSLRLDPGKHRITVSTRSGLFFEEEVEIKPGEQVRLALGATERKAHPVPVAVDPPTAFYVATGVTLALGGVALWSALDTLQASNDYDRDLPSLTIDEAQRRLDDGHERELRTNLLLGATGAAALTTAVIGVFITDWGMERSVGVAVMPTQLVIAGRF
jgi:hypothetical protein